MGDLVFNAEMTFGSWTHVHMDLLERLSLFHGIFIFSLAVPSSCCPELCNCHVGRVNCTGKGLRYVPENISPLTIALLLPRNAISALRPSSFFRLDHLQRLELQINLLSQLHLQAFQGLQSLRYLDLSFNLITYLQPETFNPLTSLTTLNLGNNRIRSLDPSAFRLLPSIQELLLHNNDLHVLDVSVLQKVPSAASFRLDGNPWACTCQILPLWRWMDENRDKIQEKEAIRCGLPGNRDQYPVLAIGKNHFRRCLENFTKHDYLFIFLIGIGLFMCSIFACFISSLAVVAYNRLRFKYKTRPHVYKKKIGAYVNRVVIDDEETNKAI
ncbi:leucine-rich repeat-containing protein 26 [Ambystoma mexicanum]|uniref:leucine-rich repeat-containing protein 26 n=1 Tax=Ambystoma mexicanum TaxID=8296 RepID=UPI0037E81992